MTQFFSVLLCVVFLVIALTIFLSGSYVFYQNNFSLKSFALFYPAMGGLLITCYYLMKDYVPHIGEVKKDNQQIEFSMLFRDKVLPLSLINRTSFDDIGQDLTGYRINDFNQCLIRDYFTRKIPNSSDLKVIASPLPATYLDILDFSIIEYLGAKLNMDYSSLSKGRSISKQEILEKNKENFVLSVSSEMLKSLRKINGHTCRNPDVPFQNEVKDWFLPIGTNYKKITKDNFRSHVFENKAWQFKINIFGYNKGHFDPMNFPLHRFLRGNDLEAKGKNSELLKFKIYFLLEKRIEYKFSDDFENSIEWVNALTESMENDFSWDILKKRIKDEFITRQI